MAFRLTSSNGSLTYASFALARIGDLAFAGALTWTVDQAGDGAPVVVDLTGMAYSSLLITVSAGIRHTGQRVSTLATVGHVTGNVLIRRPNSVVEWMTCGGASGGFTWYQGSGTGGILRQIVGQDTGYCEAQNNDGNVDVVVNFENIAMYDGFNIEALAYTAVNTPCNTTLNLKQISGVSTSGIHVSASAIVTKVANVTMNCTNVVNTGTGAFAGFYQYVLNAGGSETVTLNTTNCIYGINQRRVFDQFGTPLSTPFVGTDTSPINSSTIDEFVSSTDLYSAKSKAKRNKAGASSGVVNDTLGVAYTIPPNIGFSATLPTTKLYFNADLLPPAISLPTTKKSTNTATVTWLNAQTLPLNIKALSTTKGTVQNSVSQATAASAAAQIHFIDMFSSNTLNANQTVGGGTATLNIADRENSLNTNFVVNAVVVYIWNPATNTVRGYLTDPTASVGGLEATAIGQYQVTTFTFATSAVAAKAGDVIIAELWAFFTQTDALSHTALYAFSGTVETLAENTVVTDHASYLLLAEDISFGLEEFGETGGIIGSGVF